MKGSKRVKEREREIMGEREKGIEREREREIRERSIRDSLIAESRV